MAVKPFSKTKVRLPWGPIVFGIVIVGYTVFALTRPINATQATPVDLALPTPSTLAISWPSYGQSAVGVNGNGVLATNGNQKGAPVASIAKTMLAVMILEKKPLKLGEQGPTLTMTMADQDLYTSYLKQNGSVVPIQQGEQITEYQLLQALMLPSGDNIADTIAIWGWGSTDAYLAAANQQVADWGLAETHFDDPSGLSPKTVSSAHDLILLGQKILAEPVLAQIVGQSTVTLPVVGQVSNVDWLLGTDNVIGIKTGNTPEAGGCFLGAVKVTINNQPAVMLTAILGAANLTSVLHDTQKFIETNGGDFQSVTVVKAGQKVATYHPSWGKSVDVVAKSDVAVVATDGQKTTTKLDLPAFKSDQAKGGKVGSLTATAGNSTVATDLTLAAKFTGPSVLWRLLHP